MRASIFISMAFVLLVNQFRSQTVLKIVSNSYIDYTKDKRITQQGEAAYIITFNNPLKIVRVQGPNNFDLSMVVDNFIKEPMTDPEEYDFTWTVNDKHIQGYWLICKKDKNYPKGLQFQIYQFYNDGRYRIFNDLQVL